MIEENKILTHSHIDYEHQEYNEKYCLSSILLDGDISENITPVLFYYQKNQIIFNALKELRKKCMPDIVILKKHLEEKGELKMAGGASYIAELTNLIPSKCNINYYIDELTTSFYQRSLLCIYEDGINEIYARKPLDEIEKRHQKRINEILKPQKECYIKKGISFNDLVKKEFPQEIWIVDQLIKDGFTLLVGGSKIGKSWLALQLVLAVDKGESFLGNLQTTKMGVVYFALEDSEERIRMRLSKYGVENFNGAWLETSWKNNLLSLKDYLIENPQFNVVIIDTLQKFAMINDMNNYVETVKALSILKSIADELKVEIIAIHHTRKGSENGGSGDWMDSGLGSMGLNATADCTITLTRKRDSSEGFLRATGRDIEDIFWSLSWDKALCSYTKLEDVPKEKLLSEEQKIILQILEEETEPVPTGVIAQKAEKSEGNVINILKRLEKNGLVKKIERGFWGLSKLTTSLPPNGELSR